MTWNTKTGIYLASHWQSSILLRKCMTHQEINFCMILSTFLVQDRVSKIVALLMSEVKPKRPDDDTEEFLSS